MRCDVAVVGGGIFGRVIGRHLSSQGHDVVIIDNQQALAGSRPSACLMKPSWFAGMGKACTDPALEVLDRHFGVKDLQFRLGPARVGGVKWCDPRSIAATHSEVRELKDTAIEVDSGLVHCEDRGEPVEADTVIVAAGVWSSDLVPIPGLSSRVGASCFYAGEQVEEPFIRPWAPYKQIVAFNMHDGLWVGDGSAIIPENWNQRRTLQTVERCRAAVGLASDVLSEKITVGHRPYMPKKMFRGDPCYLEELRPGVWAATGGAKNGTIAAGWCAHILGQALQ